MGIPIRALLVEDSSDYAELLLRELRRGGYEPTSERVDTPESLGAALNQEPWDIVFADYSMPRFNGVAALRMIRGRGLDTPFVFVSGTIGEDTAVEAMKDGANDYLVKGHLKRLIPAVERELRDAQVRRERKQAEEVSQYLAYYDPLTALPNRALIRDLLQKAVMTARYEKKPVAFMLIDLDRFKEINDTLGHHRGDMLLQKAGSLIKDTLREGMIVARLGGDEFGVLLPATGVHGAIRSAEKIHKAFGEPLLIDGLPIHLEGSIGIALFPVHGSNADIIFRRADVAMYSAKGSGGGYAVYDPRRDPYTPRRLALMGELRRAISESQLRLHFQPKVDLQTGQSIGAEALVRWQHPEQGLIPPNLFIASAERTGLIKPLTLWVFNAALVQWAEWGPGGSDLSVAVNLSPRNLSDPALPDQIVKIIDESGIPPGRVVLEITEGAIMADPNRAHEVLMFLGGMGLHLSIDDFGTGYSSLAYLKKLPVNEIKIDRSFVKDMTADGNNEVIVRSIIDLGHNLGMTVVAEGVEDRETWNRLADMGCDVAQGYFMSRPISQNELIEWFRTRPRVGI